jgi:SAM-dependent methyltransferase
LGQTSHVIDEYGESFAEVYDRWYPRHDVATAITGALVPSGGRRLLELGVGTGALALPLATAGWDVTGVDSSPSMLEVFEAKRRAAHDGHDARDGPGPTAYLGDAADPSTWRPGPYDVVLAAWNLVTNLADRDAQAAMFRGATAALDDDGRLIVEAFVPAPPPRRERRLSVGASHDGATVRIHSDADPATATVVGRHVELADGVVSVRTWRLCWITPAELDDLARDAGLVLVARHEDWSGAPFEPLDSSHHVSWYARG